MTDTKRSSSDSPVPTNVWEDLYAEGNFLNRYPWDVVVSFLYRHASSARKPLSELNILEIGCGSASNLWFAAREGASVTGIDCSSSALNFARQRFSDDKLHGEFFECYLPELPDFELASFDCIIDRATLATCPPETILQTNEKLAQLIKPDGKYLATFYGKQHSSFHSGETQPDGSTGNISTGSLVGIGSLTFLDSETIDELYLQHWEALELQNILRTEHTGNNKLVHEEWHLTATPKLPK